MLLVKSTQKYAQLISVFFKFDESLTVGQKIALG